MLSKLVTLILLCGRFSDKLSITVFTHRKSDFGRPIMMDMKLEHSEYFISCRTSTLWIFLYIKHIFISYLDSSSYSCYSFFHFYWPHSEAPLDKYKLKSDLDLRFFRNLTLIESQSCVEAESFLYHLLFSI